MNQKDKAFAYQIFLYLAALFITSLVVSNLIFQKFFYWQPFEATVFGIPLFELSVGILPYPITFLITDLISEIFGQKKANQVVVAGIFASFFSIGILLLADFVPAIQSSPIDNETFSQVFSLSPLAVLASMIAYLFAQFIDIKLYHYWKKVTQGKHLWLRNNFSTFASQFLDTFTVILLLCLFGVLPWDLFLGLVVSGFIFKVLVAAIDTPFLYLSVYLIRKRFNLKVGEEIQLEN
ncbi:MAG: queuosine precursor transporter [Flavobacteriales bacterium]|jgi:queuosine precursor transporter|nr:queuosine precursor transporter [Flavobacteriaceae bacterium]MDO7580882.1 queuosine precursor transporter [Flavobacteriaceae bacterium]MDO7590926.1 queuosine precursor transporter [Flavobacteriaceae bacterium]MDO7599451.1 queuosine precursor transporter [Flavobacteriaceae bacterium]MDO7616202.1 queuosine precursor transporter [Flavobacteriaceae bacterium]|tara:strand:- start:764 stop:1471 length:708 start_codon:yes stop_codon:yes gene_type:complete